MTRYRVQFEQRSDNPYLRTWFAEYRGWSTLWLWTDIDGQWFGHETEDDAYGAIGRHVRRAAGISDEQFHAMARAALGLPEDES